jgi:hypothetical protein
LDRFDTRQAVILCSARTHSRCVSVSTLFDGSPIT